MPAVWKGMSQLLKSEKLRGVLRYFPIALGCALYALTFNVFLRPYNIMPGGVSGIALIINTVLGRPSVGTIILLINIPLFITAAIVLGRKYLISTAFGTVLCSVLIDVFIFIPGVETEPILAALYGGLLSGCSFGIIIFFGGSTGGVDIVASLVRHKRPSAKMGKLILAMDAVVVICAAIVFRSVSSAMYAIVVFYVSSLVMDAILYGSQNARIAYIITDKHEELAKAIDDRLDRGATFIHARGVYTGEEREIILCAVKRMQVSLLKRIVREVDENAFLILTNANEVLGNGFTLPVPEKKKKS